MFYIDKSRLKFDKYCEIIIVVRKRIDIIKFDTRIYRFCLKQWRLEYVIYFLYWSTEQNLRNIFSIIRSMYVITFSFYYFYLSFKHHVEVIKSSPISLPNESTLQLPCYILYTVIIFFSLFSFLIQSSRTVPTITDSTLKPIHPSLSLIRIQPLLQPTSVALRQHSHP